jgi:hypothetical protein
MKTITIPVDVARRIAKVLPSEQGFHRKVDPLLSAAVLSFRALIPADDPLPPPTPGPYRIGRHGSCIVTDHPVEGMNGSDAINYYGGHMVAESVARQNAPLLAAAWDLLEACRAILDAHGPDYMPMVTEAVAKAESRS